MSKVLVIGCGGVASVAISKCCQVSDVFTELCIASRTKSKCDALAAKLAPNTKTKITTAQVDADDVQQLCDLINSYKPDLVMNIALPYQDLTIMDACLACGVNYMDTANYEPENTDDPAWRAVYEKRCKEAGFSAYFDYSWQWAYAKKFEEAGLTALLGSGFDPGVTQAYCAYAKKHEFDTIDTIDILDCNGGDHGYAFATNFNPEINLREVSAPGSYWENGHWVEIPAMSIKREYDFDKVGQKDMYLLHHEEIESLAKSVPDNGGVYLVPAFVGLGAPHWDSEARGMMIGLTRGTTKAHVARAALEGIAFQCAEVLEAMQLDAGTELKELRVDGGASRNNLLMQFQADISGVPVIRPAITETTALGAAFLAGLSTGVWESCEEISALWRVDRVFEPSMTADRREYLMNQWARAVGRARNWNK